MQEDFRLARLILDTLKAASQPGSVSQLDMVVLIESWNGERMSPEELERGLKRLERSHINQEIVDTLSRRTGVVSPIGGHTVNSSVPDGPKPIMPPITPHLNPDDPTLPAFTAEDARAWVLAHPTYARVNTSTATADDITVAFMTSAEGGTLLNNIKLGDLAPEAVVCVVRIRGKWREDAVTRNPRRPITPGGEAYTYLAYDGRTGNPLALCWNSTPYLG